jgi:hypothetical protein
LTSALPEAEPETVTRTKSWTSPKVRHRAEYRSLKDSTLLYGKDVTEGDGIKKQRAVHEGPVFDVVNINYTSETKDTQQIGGHAGQPDASKTADTSPSVNYHGTQYIRIYSRAIINALQCVVNYCPYRSLVGNPVDTTEPYSILVHHWELLERFRENFHPDSVKEDATDCEVNDTYEHLGYLLDFMESELREKVNKEYERWNQPVPKASFEMLWLLLRPGTDVYCDQAYTDCREPWEVSHLTFDIMNKSWNEYTGLIWHLDGDEASMRPYEGAFNVPRFHGEKPIHELRIFPCEYHVDNEKRQKILTDRGELFFKLRQKRCMYFDGDCDMIPRTPASDILVSFQQLADCLIQFKGYVMLEPVQQETDKCDSFLYSVEAVDQKPSVLPICICSRCSAMDTERTKPAKFEGYNKIDMKTVTKLSAHQ